ncbi:MAG: hypothetical protein ABSB01_19970 [Streptosporangiaceae bacterium]
MSAPPTTAAWCSSPSRPRAREQVGASRIQVQALLRGTVARLSDGELAGLVAASETMGRMIEMLQQRTSRS